jgi:hypothetical protein
VAFFNHVGTVDLVVDMFGYFMAGPDVGIESLAFAQSTVDATAHAAVVAVNWTITDANPNASNVGGDITFRRVGSQPDSYVGLPVTESFSPGACCGMATFVSGDTHRSSYTYNLVVPSTSDSATAHWVVALVHLYDDQGNLLLATGSDLNGYPGATLTASTNAGSTAPTYQGIYYQTISNNRLYLYDGATRAAVYNFQPQDMAEDFWQGSITVTGPGGQTLTSRFAQAQVNGQRLTYPCQDHGSGQDDCSVPVLFPKGMATGTWVVSKLVLTSNAGTTAVYDNLNAAPITVGDDNSFNGSGFSITPNPADNWRSDVDLAVTMRVNGARQGVSAIYVDADLNGHCPVMSSTPTVNANGAYSITVRMYKGTQQCGVSGIAIVDGAGDVALYGQRYFAPDPGLDVTQVPDTTPPSVSSVSVSPASFPAGNLPNSITVTAHAAIGMAPIDEADSYVYDSAGNVVGQEAGGASQAADGTVLVGVYMNRPVAPGVYTIGFRLVDAGRLATTYGMPGGNPMPGGPLTVTVT